MFHRLEDLTFINEKKWDTIRMAPLSLEHQVRICGVRVRYQTAGKTQATSQQFLFGRAIAIL
jgi:hypothetical protein